MTWDEQTRIEKLAGEIAWYDQQAQTDGRKALQYRLEIGARLVEAKTLLPHGEFMPWVSAHFGWSQEHARSHIILHRNFKRACNLRGDLSMREALRIIRSEQCAGKPAPPQPPGAVVVIWLRDPDISADLEQQIEAEVSALVPVVKVTVRRKKGNSGTDDPKTD